MLCYQEDDTLAMQRQPLKVYIRLQRQQVCQDKARMRQVVARLDF